MVKLKPKAWIIDIQVTFKWMNHGAKGAGGQIALLVINRPHLTGKRII